MKSIRLRDIEEGAYWLTYCWGFKDKLSGSQFRTARRLLIGSAEDGHSIAVMEKLAENFPVLLGKQVEFERVMAELVRICKVPNWWNPATGGHDYIHSGMLALRQAFYDRNKYSLDHCLNSMEGAINAQSKVGALFWVMKADESGKGAGLHIAQRLLAIATRHEHAPAKRLMQNVYLRHAKSLSNDGNFIGQTAWLLAGGISPVIDRIEVVTFTKNQHPDLRADFILANPPFNISDWWHGSLTGDPRWEFGDPPAGNANYAWLQHMLYHLKPTGRAGIVLANGSMSSSQNSEGDIRRAMVDADVVEVMIALPGQLFFNTQIPACLWFLVKQKTTRRGEVLFIDARKLGTMISRVQTEFTDEVIDRIAGTVSAWRGEGGEYQDTPGYCRSVKLAEIAEHGHVLTPGRYVGAEAVEDNDEAFADKMQSLTEKLGEQMAKGAELDQLIRQKLGGLGYDF